jgi:hypothetical protein
VAKKLPSEATEQDRDSVISRIAPVGEHPEFYTFLFYGRAKTGKTLLTTTFPKPMLLIDVKDKGANTARGIPGIDSVSINHWDEYEELYHHLVKKGAKYKTISTDPTTELQRLAMDAVRAEKGKGETDVLAQRDWGQIGGKMTTWLGHYRDLVEKNHFIVFTAHERTSTTEDSSLDQLDPVVGPQLSPSVGGFLCGAVDAIGHTFIREKKSKKEDGTKTRQVQYCLRIGPHAYYTTGIRRPREFTPPDVIVNPTFGKLMAITRGEEFVRKST